MRAVEFLLEYNQAKTAQVFGHKLITALANDPGAHFPAPLGTSREYLRQKDKIGATPDEASAQLIIKDILSAIELADPTPNKEYTQWLAKCYANETQKIEDITSKGLDWLKKYHQFKVKRLLPDNLRNIANIKFSQLYDIIANKELNAKLDDIENAPSKDKGESEVILDNAEVRIIVPHNEAAACYYGQGTRWCTAANNNNMFGRYHQRGEIYILLPKQPRYDGEKYQAHFESHQFMDENDDPIDITELFFERFGDLATVFKQFKPEIKQYVIFADDAQLQNLLDQIKEISYDYINDLISEWEMENDEWQGWIADNTNEEGDVDWGKVGTYLDFNEYARDVYNELESAVDINAREAKEYATRMQMLSGQNEMVQINELEWVVYWGIETKESPNRRHRYDGDFSLNKFANWVKDLIVTATTVRRIQPVSQQEVNQKVLGI